MNVVKTSLSRKVAVCIGIAFILMLTIIFCTSKTIMLTGFKKLEKQDVETNITRLQHGIDRELDNLSAICGDWAPWDDARDFILNKDPNFIKTDLSIECLSNLKLNFMMFIDKERKIFHTSVIDYVNKNDSNLPEGLAELILAQKRLFNIKEPTDCKTGVLILSGFPILVAAQPISNNSFEKPISGTLIIGRYMDSTVLENLRTQTCLDIQTAKNESGIKILNKDIISGYAKIYDINKENYITLQINLPRKTYNYGMHIIHYFILTMTLISLLIMGVLLFVLRSIILKPINKLTSVFNDIDKDYNTSTKLYTERNDEIGSLARSFDLLMNHLKQRIIELAEKQDTTNCLNLELMKTTEKLQEANSELKSFVYVASHDLREPLRKIIVFAEMLKKSLKDKIEGSDIESLHYMVDGAERMKKMIDGLLVYSRVSTQPHPLQKVDLDEILSQICKFDLAFLIEERNVEIRKPQNLPCIIADPSQMTQLMQNLIANGIKYQKKDNKPVITITSRPDANGMVKIEVTDNGIGIKPEYHNSVFAMFKRLHGKEYEGTGIGLSVCKKIVERHNGKIGLESQPGQGSTFWFTIAEAPAAVPQATTA